MASLAASRSSNALASLRPRVRRPSASSRRSLARSAAPPATGAAASEYEMRTLTTWLLAEERSGRVDNELATVLSSIATACKQIGSLVTRAPLAGMTGLQGTANISGEDQKKLDVVSNEVFCSCLTQSGRTGIIASEEEDVPVAVEATRDGKYIAVFDPLDGSSNIDAAVSTGSIWGIYEPSESCVPTWGEEGDTPSLDEVTQNCIVNVCQPGENLVCAGYCMYSSSTILVLTIGSGVFGFTLDPAVGEFVLSHDDIKTPVDGRIYSFNEGNYAGWSEGMKAYMDHTKAPEGAGSKPYSSRYIGSLVGDFHRTMLYGGVYGYPADATNLTGKLRLLYECAPMSFIMEQAGGAGSDGTGRVLEIVPTEVHQRVPLFVGSRNEVEKIEKYLAA